MAIKLKPVSKYVVMCGPVDVIDAVRRSGVKIDPMFKVNSTTIKVADWVPQMVEFWRSSKNDEGTLFADMDLEEFLRRMASQYS